MTREQALHLIKRIILKKKAFPAFILIFIVLISLAGYFILRESTTTGVEVEVDAQELPLAGIEFYASIHKPSQTKVSRFVFKERDHEAYYIHWESSHQGVGGIFASLIYLPHAMSVNVRDFLSSEKYFRYRYACGQVDEERSMEMEIVRRGSFETFDLHGEKYDARCSLGGPSESICSFPYRRGTMLVHAINFGEYIDCEGFLKALYNPEKGGLLIPAEFMELYRLVTTTQKSAPHSFGNIAHSSFIGGYSFQFEHPENKQDITLSFTEPILLCCGGLVERDGIQMCDYRGYFRSYPHIDWRANAGDYGVIILSPSQETALQVLSQISTQLPPQKIPRVEGECLPKR